MIIQLNQLFINTDNVATISPYETSKDKTTEFGIIINGIKYTIFESKDNSFDELQKERNKVFNIISTIINLLTSNPVQRLKLGEENESERNDSRVE